MQKEYNVYILKCSDGSYYTGSTSNLKKRIHEHESGMIKGYTSSRLPVEYVFSQKFSNAVDAIEAERQIKGWTRNKKEALIAGRFDLLHSLSECKNESHCKNK